MKNWKHFRLMTVIAIIALIGVTIACDNNNDTDDPKPQTELIHPFEGLELTVKGTFTNTEWTGVAGKIEALINEHLSGITIPPLQTAKKNAYAACEKIIVEQTSEYANWKTDGDGKTVFLNYAALDAMTTTIIDDAINSMYVDGKDKDGVAY
jgi:hypothetical protein